MLLAAKFKLIGALLTVGLALVVQAEEEQSLSKLDWWKKTNFYHIYIRSFKDTDGNGQGDLRGIIEKLDYLKLIGVETLLLSPFYSSPMRDGGYDIDDYTAINPLFGTMQDFDNLLAGLKERGMRLVIDFVPNHSSDEHLWFKCSERALIEPERCGRYKDYYIWSNSTRFQNSRPTNWISLFGGQTAWRWSPIRKEFYFHQFLPQQPDLNLRNPLVREELKEIVRFWLRKGVDGIRVDAVLHFLEDTIHWRDEPQDPAWRPHWNPYDRLLHIYTRSLKESATVVKDWYEVAREPEFGTDKLVIVEAYDPIPNLIHYYGPSHMDRYSHMPFDFELFKINEETIAPHFIETTITDWLNATAALGFPDEQGAISPWSCWVTGNHDNKRIVNRVGDTQADALKYIAYLVPGVPVAYYGDEIGMHDANFNMIPRRTVEEGEPTRLIFRAPMAWSAQEPSAGFSNNSDTWMPLNTHYKLNNVEGMLKGEGKNHLKNFIQLQNVRKQYLETLSFGELTFFRNHPLESSQIFAMARTHPRFGNLLLLVNLDNYSDERVRLVQKPELSGPTDPKPPKSAKVVMMNKVTEFNGLFEGAKVELDGLVLAKSQAVLFVY